MQYSVMIRINPDEFELNFLMRHVGYLVMAEELDLGYWWLYVPPYDDFVSNHVKTKKSLHFLPEHVRWRFPPSPSVEYSNGFQPLPQFPLRYDQLNIFL